MLNLLIVTLGPIIAIIVYIYIKDEHEKEPGHLLFGSFFLGAIIALCISLIGSSAIAQWIPFSESNRIMETFIYAFFFVALSEETGKYLIVRYYSQPKSQFNEPFDGIVYAVMVSMGFASVENVLYVIQGGITTALLRAFTAVPAHAVCAIIMGYFMGKAKFNGTRIKHNILGLFFAILLHGSYDFFLFANFVPGMWLGAFFSLGLGLFLSNRAIEDHRKSSVFREP